MIEAVGLTKRYGDKTAVYNLSFQVRPGAVTGFLGPNGSGKSTTMRMILGLDNPTSGSVTIGGFPYRKLPNAARQVGALLDAKAVHGGRHARNHLLCLAQLSGIPERRVDEVLGVVGLQDVARRRSKGFSLGMGQRLGIAAALLGDPQVLLFDEPVNGLDPEGILWVRNLMKSLAAEGRTIFVSSHLMSEMALTADHLIVIGRGQLLSDLSVQDFIAANSAGFARVRTPHTEPQLREKLATALAESGGHVLTEPDGALRVTGLALPRISDIAHDTDVRLWELSPHQASLEEAYMRMTQGAVDYRSTVDPKAGLQQPVPPGFQPPTPVPGQGQPGWYAPPPPQHGYAPPQPVHAPPTAQGPYGTPNPYTQPPAPAQPGDTPTHTLGASPAPAPAGPPGDTPTRAFGPPVGPASARAAQAAVQAPQPPAQTPQAAPAQLTAAQAGATAQAPQPPTAEAAVPAPADRPGTTPAAAPQTPAPVGPPGDTATRTFGPLPVNPAPAQAAQPPVQAPQTPADRPSATPASAPAAAPEGQVPGSLAKARGGASDVPTTQPEDSR